MNKNTKDDNMKKSSKGFYAALGISAVMIGSACFFSYNEGNKLSDKNPAVIKPQSSDAAVDNKQTNIPRTTSVSKTRPVTTTEITSVTSTRPLVTIPAAEIIKTEPPKNTQTSAQKPADSPTIAGKLENPKPPLKDISSVINPFSGGELVKNETTGSWQTHNGTDIKAESGAEVYAISSGEVTDITTDNLWGVTVTVNHHNGYISKYCGLGSDLSVQKGDTVASGSVIGVVGTSADIESALEPHLHIELTHNGSYIDPVAAVAKK
ncbi:MAG: M23 family metallopeptidase [Ruminococcus sp.]|nr:M23 family metallopeptidase [Ruminococcus sp.]